MSKIRAQIVKELHAPARRNYPRRRVIVRGLNETWQSDLLQINQHAHENKGYNFILVVIDVFSKYVWTEPMKDKSAKTVTAAFSQILSQAGPSRFPKNLQTDHGKEYYNHDFNKLMKKYSINHYSTFSTKKASIAERVIRTLKDNLHRSFSMRGTYRWYDILTNITKAYNNRKHRTIGMKPVDVTKDKEKLLLDTVYSNIKVVGKRKFKIGQVVRISKQKMLFEKSYTPNYSTELFKIKQIRISNPTVYVLEDMNGQPIAGTFYAEELQPAMFDDVYLVEKVLKRKGDHVYVKWLGFDKTHNSWILNTNKL